MPRGGSVGYERRRGRLRAGVRLLLATGLLLGLPVLGPVSAQARGAIYSYVDESGVTHFTNVPRGDPRFQKMRDAAPLRRRHRPPRRADYDVMIGQIARTYSVPPALVKAVIAAESAFDPQAVSHKGAQGLMQLMPATAAVLGVENAFEPAQNVRGGVNYLREMIDRYGDLTRAVAAYNAGPAAVDRYGGIPPYRETQAYVDRVLNYYRHYHGDFPR